MLYSALEQCKSRANLLSPACPSVVPRLSQQYKDHNARHKRNTRVVNDATETIILAGEVDGDCAVPTVRSAAELLWFYRATTQHGLEVYTAGHPAPK